MTVVDKNLGAYTLLSRIGRGGMGSVWKARQRALGGVSGLVAIKLIHADRLDDNDVRARLLKEAQLCMLLRSSNIVTVFDVGEAADGTCYIVMEWVEGLDLSTLCTRMWEKGESFSESEIAYVISEILKGLMHAHELASEGRKFSVIHRDVSPQNIIISSRGEIKLLDFGVARISCEETTSPLTAKGKIRYMPPEQLRGNSRHPTLDIFPVGAILHELLDRRKFRVDAVDDAQLFGFSIAGIVPPLSDSAIESSLLEQMRDDMLSFDYRRRPQSARDAFERIVTWSGYRNTTLELEAAVRRHLAPKQAKSVESSTFVRAVAGGGQLGRGASDPVQVDSDDVQLVDNGDGNVAPSGAANPQHDPTEVVSSPLPRSPSTPGPARTTQRRSVGLVAMLLAAAAISLLILGMLGGKFLSARAANGQQFALGGAAQPESRAAPAGAVQAVPGDHDPGAAAEALGPAGEDLLVLDSDDESDLADDEDRSTAIRGQARGQEPKPSRPPKPSTPKVNESARVLDASTPEALDSPATTEVVVALGADVNWGEVDIDGVSFHLDRWASKKSDRQQVRVGQAKSIAYRTLAGDKMRSQSAIEIPPTGRRLVLGPRGLE